MGALQNENLGNQGVLRHTSATLKDTFSVFFLYTDLLEACKNLWIKKK